ncbi:MAG: glycosyltransferase family 9 protein [Planctomycetota bacterium]
MESTGAKGGRSPRILIVRLSAIGDVIHGLPVLNALRERFSQARLAWVVEGRSAELLRGHEALDELITVPKGWLRSPRAVWKLARRLRSFEANVAIDAQGLAKSAIATWLSGTRRRIGFGGYWGRELSTWLNTELVRTTAPHAVDRNLQLLLPLGIERPSVRFGIPEGPSEATTAEREIRKAGFGDGFGVIHPGAGWPSKLWPSDRYAEVARCLGRERGFPTILAWGSPKERSWAEQIVRDSAGHAQLAPALALRQLAALARRAQLFLGSDSGPLHLAAAVGTPCVGLYGPWPAQRHGPYGPRHVTIQKMTMEGSTRQRRHASAKYMEAIDVASVVEACERVLGRKASQTAA